MLTVCDNAAGEACPLWPGQPITAHWGIEDPAAIEGSDIDKERAFVTAFRYLKNRVSLLISLPVASLNRLALTQPICRTSGAAKAAPRQVPKSHEVAALCSGGPGHGPVAGDGHRLRHHGRAPGRRQRRPRPARQHAATGAMLVVLITMLGPISGAHFNPAVTAVFALRREIALGDAAGYVVAQFAGGILGVFIAHAMFDESRTSIVDGGPVRPGAMAVGSRGGVRAPPHHPADASRQSRAVATSVGLYITAAYWFTASTSFANPAVTIARASPTRSRASGQPTLHRSSCAIRWSRGCSFRRQMAERHQGQSMTGVVVGSSQTLRLCDADFPRSAAGQAAA